VWKDGRVPSDSDIYGQLMEYSEQPQLLIEDADGHPILNGALDFGNVVVGQSKDLDIKLCNFGNTQLTINYPPDGVGMTIPDMPYTFLTPSPKTISPATCYDMTVHFAPTAAGSYSGNASTNYKTTIDSTGGKTTLYFSGNGTGIQSLTITTTSLPEGSLSSFYSAILSGYGGVFPYTWSITSGSLPAGLTLNAFTGVISGTPTSPGSFAITFRVTDNTVPVNASAVRQLTIRISVVSITTSSLKQWTQGVEYGNTPAQVLTASGGTPPYSWSVSGGNLPTGMTLDAATGTVTGIPTASGTFTFTAMVTDSAGTPQSATKDLSITINPPPFVSTTSLASGVVAVAYSQLVLMTGGTLPVTWSVTGALPPGLTLNSGTGAITGTPTASGTYSFTIKVADASGALYSKSLSIKVNATLDISNAGGTITGGTVGIAYLYPFIATGGSSPYSWAVTAGSLPPGLNLNPATGILSGTATGLGTYEFVITVSDMGGNSASKLFSITVFDPSSGPGLGDAVISLSAESIDFLKVHIGTVARRTLGISNVGTSDLRINSVSRPTTPFSIERDDCSATTLPPGAFCKVSLVFNPAFIAVFDPYYLAISSNDSADPVKSVAMKGEGIDPGVQIFGDVRELPPAYWAADQIEVIYNNGITNGCFSDGVTRLFCPEALVSREGMAAFIIRAIGEPASTAPYNAYFDDIVNDGFAGYINRMSELGITMGCGTRVYCPYSNISREQMAVFIVRAMGEQPSSMAYNAYFDDIANDGFAGYINRMNELGVTAGCGTRAYCPHSATTRAEMAVFLFKAFIELPGLLY